jgi:two-component system OmpR family sensor kinase
MSRFFRSVGTRLSLALLLVVTAALGLMYLAVVPSLRSRLENTRVNQLAVAAERLVPEASETFLQQDFVDTTAHDVGARVMIFQTSPVPGGSTVGSPVADSSGFQPSHAEPTNDPVATRALQSGEVEHGFVTDGKIRYAEAAVPYDSGAFVLLLRDSLENQLGSVHMVQHRVLLSAGAALAIALVLGYGGAWIFARRIRRLERAADRIAGGDFDEPVRDSGGDELGDLAVAFERMRVRLAQLDDARREFVANASHELRTPLFSLAGFLELLDDEDLDEATRLEFITSMREQVHRLTKLASDLLDLSRLDAGRLRVEREPVDLRSLAEELAEEFAPVAAATGHDLELGTSGAAIALADELRALQIGRILVENAIRHTAPGTTVRVRTLTRGENAVLEVEDQGGGIARERQEQLFERFFRLDGTRASGSGLGLAIARQLSELMDGTVTVDSVPGRTVFALRLPLAARLEPEPQAVGATD